MCQDNRCVPRPVEQRAEGTQALPPPSPQQCELQPVYFDFDDHSLRPDARSTLEANVQCMRERNIQKIMVTGMCDPRGTEEYNMALGHRRANSVRDYLQRLGVQRNRIETRSVGEEYATGTDEASWARDRRAEITPR